MYHSSRALELLLRLGGSWGSGVELGGGSMIGINGRFSEDQGIMQGGGGYEDRDLMYSVV